MSILFLDGNFLVRVIDRALAECAAVLGNGRPAKKIERITLPYAVTPSAMVVNRDLAPIGIALCDVLKPHFDFRAFPAWVLAPAALARVDRARHAWQAPRARSRLFTDGTAPWCSKADLEDYRLRSQVFRNLVAGVHDA